MNIIFITGGLTPYRIAFCDSIVDFMKKNNIGNFKLFLMSEGKFNNNYDNKLLMRPYAEFLEGKTIVLKDNTTRFMINPKIARKVIEESPTFIILGGSWLHPSTWLLLLNKNKIKAPIYFWAESHFHNGIKRKQKKKWKEFFKKVIYNKFDGFFVPGIYAMEAIKSTNCRNCNNCIKLPNLVENNKYLMANNRRVNKVYLKQKYNIDLSKIVLFTPSRLVDLKGLLEFIKNGKDLLKNSFTWVIAGIGPLEDEIKKISIEYQIDIQLIGFVDQDIIIDYLAISDWFVLPSLSDPNPLSVIEALWAGLPLALSKYVGNAPEALIEGENGYLFDTLLPISVNEVLKKMILSKNDWMKLASSKSLEIARNGFDMEKETEKLINYIEKVDFDYE